MTTRNVLVFGLISFFLYACKKTDNNSCVTNYGSPTAAEVTALRNYTISNGIFCDVKSIPIISKKLSNIFPIGCHF